jgi:RNA polymerase sigma factor (sigma-70 family)
VNATRLLQWAIHIDDHISSETAGMSDEGTITHLIARLKRGDRDAAQGLWETYFPRLVTMARARLRGLVAWADEEDVVQTAFHSFYQGVERGQFPSLRGRNDLWSLLFVLTVRQAINLVKHERRQSRGGGRLVSLGALEEDLLDGLLSTEPSPELAAQMADECRRLLGRLRDDSLRAVALWKMEGHTNREIASRLGCVETTVERKLRTIRGLWSSEESA